MNPVWECPSICFIIIPIFFRLDNRKAVLVMMTELMENRRQSISSKHWMLDVIHTMPHPQQALAVQAVSSKSDVLIDIFPFSDKTMISHRFDHCILIYPLLGQCILIWSFFLCVCYWIRMSYLLQNFMWAYVASAFHCNVSKPITRSVFSYVVLCLLVIVVILNVDCWDHSSSEGL